MGWKGTLRSVRAEIRRAEKRQIQYEKMRQAEQARDLVYEQDNYLEKIKSSHKIFAEKIDWNIFLKASEPISPIKTNSREAEAISKYENYRPGWIVRKLRLVQWRKNSLKRNVEKAKQKDEEEYNAQRRQFEYDHAQWKHDKDLAERITSNDLSAYEQVLTSKSVFKDGGIVCSAISMTFNNNVLSVEVDLLSEDDALPNKIYSVTKTGKISEKDFPKTQYNQLYQDYVCSVSLATAKVIFGLFPVEKILINSMSNVLNTATGNLERQALLSVLIPRGSFQAINLSHVDPSDCMKNFNHNMNYKNTEGLKPTTQLKVSKGQAS
ncbi:hypothetical protein [Bdellovibrio bacteriovorus]|uniref:hypothetical protein n=1 Tax=Bdellovibrio bacteriovorus TaxID=959 RepID=UPI0035A81A0E